MASIQGRPPAEVVKYEAGPGDYGRCDLESNRIMVGSNSLEHDDVPEVVDTVVHEGRHAYQDYAVQHPGVRSSPAEVEGCRQNSGENYSRPEENPRRYREQA